MELDRIYLGDCLKLMRDIPDNSIDAIICDLPYGTTKNAWDSIIPLPDLWTQYKRIIKPNGAIVLFSQQPFSAALIMSNPSMFKYEWIWEKEHGTGHLNSNFAPMKIHENILVFSSAAACFVKNLDDAMVFNPQYKKGKPYKSAHTCNPKSDNYDTIWNKGAFKTEQDGEHYKPTDVLKFGRDKKKMHPTQKPVDLVAYLIRTYTNEGEIVLDNCSGSGTTAVAAWREKRHFICFEKDPIYWEKSVERVKKEQSNLTLF